MGCYSGARCSNTCSRCRSEHAGALHKMARRTPACAAWHGASAPTTSSSRFCRQGFSADRHAKWVSQFGQRVVDVVLAAFDWRMLVENSLPLEARQSSRAQRIHGMAICGRHSRLRPLLKELALDGPECRSLSATSNPVKWASCKLPEAPDLHHPSKSGCQRGD